MASLRMWRESIAIHWACVRAKHQMELWVLLYVLCSAVHCFQRHNCFVQWSEASDIKIKDKVFGLEVKKGLENCIWFTNRFNYFWEGCCNCSIRNRIHSPFRKISSIAWKKRAKSRFARICEDGNQLDPDLKTANEI
jgi:hypothetical protein